MWIGVAAHEDVESCVVFLRPGVNGDMRLGQYSNTADATVGCEVVEMNVQQCGVTLVNACAHGCFHSLEAVKVFGAPKINNQVCSGKNFAVFGDEVIK